MEWLQSLIELIKGYKKPATMAPSTKKPSTKAPTTSPPEPVNSKPLIVWNGALIGQWMDEKGWYGEGTEQWYALFSTYGTHEWGDVGDRPTAIELSKNSDKIRDWFTYRVDTIGRTLLQNPYLKVKLIENDANDLGGCFMWRPIMEQLLRMGVSENQIIIGEVFTVSVNSKIEGT